jgi:hypothetical protein
MARKSETADATPAPGVSDQQVAAYLHDHPEFLLDHPELVTTLTLPARFDAGPVVDLQHHVIARLREEVDQLRDCAEHLISTSRSNMTTQTRTHEAALTVLAAGDMAGLARAIADDLPPLLDVDVACIGFETVGTLSPLMVGIRSLPEGQVATSLGDAEVMLKAVATGDPVLFGSGAGLVSSFALVRLTPTPRPPGILALGSRNDRGFHSSQGTELLSFLARVVEDCVVRWWPAD